MIKSWSKEFHWAETGEGLCVRLQVTTKDAPGWREVSGLGRGAGEEPQSRASPRHGPGCSLSQAPCGEQI